MTTAEQHGQGSELNRPGSECVHCADARALPGTDHCDDEACVKAADEQVVRAQHPYAFVMKSYRSGEHKFALYAHATLVFERGETEQELWHNAAVRIRSEQPQTCAAENKHLGWTELCTQPSGHAGDHLNDHVGVPWQPTPSAPGGASQANYLQPVRGSFRFVGRTTAEPQTPEEAAVEGPWFGEKAAPGGGTCPVCGYISASANYCPMDGSRLGTSAPGGAAEELPWAHLYAYAQKLDHISLHGATVQTLIDELRTHAAEKRALEEQRDRLQAMYNHADTEVFRQDDLRRNAERELAEARAQLDKLTRRAIGFAETLRNIAVNALLLPDPWDDAHPEPHGEWLTDKPLSQAVVELRERAERAEAALASTKTTALQLTNALEDIVVGLPHDRCGSETCGGECGVRLRAERSLDASGLRTVETHEPGIRALKTEEGGDGKA